MPSQRRPISASRFALTLDGVQTGFLKSVDGGGVTAEVIQEAPDTSYFVKKHIGQPQYEPFTVEIDLSQPDMVYKWISATWSGNTQPKNGSIITFDSKFEAISVQEFFNALITEITFPACDGASKNPAYISLTFAPEYTRMKKGGGKVASAGKSGQKQWSPANFKLEIDGLDCSKVSKVNALTVKQTTVTDNIGDARDYQKQPSKLEFPNLTITLPEAAAQTWQNWFDDFVMKGNNADDKEKNGSLTFLAPNRKEELATINFFNLGIFRLASDKAEANTDQIKQVKAELYCERMEFHLSGSNAPAKPG